MSRLTEKYLDTMQGIERYRIEDTQITLNNMNEVGRNIFLTETEAKREKEKRESWRG